MTQKQKIPQGKLILYSESTGYVFVEPGDELTQGLINGMDFVPLAEYEKCNETNLITKHTISLDTHQHTEEGNAEYSTQLIDVKDINGLSLLERIVAGKDIIPELPIELNFAKTDIEEKLKANIKYLDHAFKILGKDEDNKSPRTRFYRFVTGDYSDEGKKYKPKSLSHIKAERCFGKFCLEGQSVLELAEEIAISNWSKLEELLTAQCYSLPATDDVWLKGAVILNMSAKALQVEGYGWLPKSKCRFVKGKLVIPGWLAQSIKEKQAAKSQ